MWPRGSPAAHATCHHLNRRHIGGSAVAEHFLDGRPGRMPATRLPGSDHRHRHCRSWPRARPRSVGAIRKVRCPVRASVRPRPAGPQEGTANQRSIRRGLPTSIRSVPGSARVDFSYVELRHAFGARLTSCACTLGDWGGAPRAHVDGSPRQAGRWPAQGRARSVAAT